VLERAMFPNTSQRPNQRLGAWLWPRQASAAVSAASPPLDVRCLQARWQAELNQTTTGFMALHAVRREGCVVDFQLDTASVDVIELLCGGGPCEPGQRLAQVLAGHADRRCVFDQYRHVLEFGAARSAHHRVAARTSMDVLRHTAVRLSDGVAVTLTNVSALRRLWALQSEIDSRRLIGPAQA
jgi:hypothetical protein